MNNINLIGNLTRDIELKYPKEDLIIGNSSLAINEFNGKEKEKTIFVDLVFFGKLAESTSNYTSKGSRVGITGRLNQDFWVTNGVQKSKHSIVVTAINFLSNKERNESDEINYKEEINSYEN